jgi:hypothetical protein
MLQRLYQGDHHDIALGLGSLAADLRALGQPARARDLDEHSLAMFQRLYHGDHQDIASGLGNLAVNMYALGEPDRARQLYEHAMRWPCGCLAATITASPSPSPKPVRSSADSATTRAPARSTSKP